MSSFHRASFCLAASLCLPLTAHAVGVPGQGTWESTLQGRDLDGNAANGFEAFYDTRLNLSWLAQAQAPAGNLSWAAANAFAAGLAVGGVTGWRLPTAAPGGDGACHFSLGASNCGYNVNTGSSELADLFTITLGNRSTVAPGGGPQAGGGLSNTGPFAQLVEQDYWMGTPYVLDAGNAWFFNTGAGMQNQASKNFTLGVWAVHAGDVAAVPEPQSWLLLAGGSALLAFWRRRDKSCRR